MENGQDTQRWTTVASSDTQNWIHSSWILVLILLQISLTVQNLSITLDSIVLLFLRITV